MRKGRISVEPVTDQRFDGIPKEAVEQDQSRQALISLLVKQTMNSSKKKEQMEEVFPEEGKKFTPMSDRSRQINRSCHVQCYSGHSHVFVNPIPVVEKQILRNVKQKREFLTTPPFLIIKEQI